MTILSYGQFPRVYELRDLINDPNSENEYFNNFEDLINQPSQDLRYDYWMTRERGLEKLDQDAWEFLKNKVLPLLSARSPIRGWEQFISLLNEARGFIYLNKIGCSGVKFISDSNLINKKRPDIEGSLNGVPVLCEVKTLFRSDMAVDISNKGEVSTIENNLSEEFLNKLKSTIDTADTQIGQYKSERYRNISDVKRVIYMTLNFDEELGEYNKEYYAQIDRYLMGKYNSEIELVFHIEKTPFTQKFYMSNATVING